ncbi:MAG: AsmA family protein [Gammaproteobacteria bacterium]|nr:AsmA family protein [Gammaproteobacteria bacterium]
MLNRTRKILLGIGLAVVAVITAAMLWISSPGQYRTALQERVTAATGYELVVAGEVDIDLLPSARLTLEDARLRNPGLPQELASASVVQLDVDRGDLLRGELTIRELRIDGFHLNVFVDASGNSIWDIARAAATSDAEETSGAAAGFPERIAAENGRLDVQNLASGHRFLLKNLQVVGSDVNLGGEAFAGQANFDVEWFDSANRRVRETAVGLIGEIEADAEAGRYSVSELDLNSTPVLLQGRVEVNGYPNNPGYQASLTSNEFDARVLLQNLGMLPAPEQEALAVPNGNPNGRWPASVAFSLTGDADGLSAEAVVNTPSQTVIEAGTDIRFASGLLPANVRYEMDIGELDVSALFAAEGSESIPGAPAFQRPERQLPNLENLILSGSIAADALTAGNLRIENLTVYTNVEDRVLDAEIPPVASLGGTFSANMRWNAANGELSLDTSGENLAISEIAPLITRLDVLSGRLHANGAFNARGQSLNGLLNGLSGDASFAVTENLVNIGLIKQIFTSIAALSPTGEAIQQWPDLIRFSEVGGDLALDGGLASEHTFNLRMDNFSAAGTGVADLRGGGFDYEVLLTMLGEPLTQTIPVSRNYQGVTWPVECAARFSDEVLQFCRPDFNAVREIFSRIGSDAGSN